MLCSRVFPNQSFTAGINTPGDVAVMKLSEMVLNDIPTADPRWGGAPPLSVSSAGNNYMYVHVHTCTYIYVHVCVCTVVILILVILTGLSESFSGSSSMIIIHQLQDKLEAHSRLLQFLSDVQLLNKVRWACSGGRLNTATEKRQLTKVVEITTVI